MLCFEKIIPEFSTMKYFIEEKYLIEHKRKDSFCVWKEDLV